MRRIPAASFRRADRTAGLVLSVVLLAAVALTVQPTVAAASSHQLETPSTIRVLLSVHDPVVRIEPPPNAITRVDGQASGSDGSLIAAGPGLRYLSLPDTAVPGEMRGLTVDAAASRAAPGQALVGPYGWDDRAWRHARRLYAELGVAPRLLPPHTGLQIGRRVQPLPTTIEVVPARSRDVSRVNGQPYRGVLRVTFQESGYSVINELPLPDYLASVVGAEMPASWDLDALKAQAVAARTYALRNRTPDGPFDICDNQNCQAYHGVASESAHTRMAVSETAREVATYNGELIQAFYSANAGDYTESSENIWGTALPYLTAVASPTDAEALTVAWGAQGYRWRRELSLAELRQSPVVQAARVGDVRDIRVLSTTQSGRPLRLQLTGTAGALTWTEAGGVVLDVEVAVVPGSGQVQLTGTAGALTLEGDAIRTAFGLPSNFVEGSLAEPRVIQLINPTARRRASLIEDGYRLVRLRRSVAFDAAPADVRLYNNAVLVAEFTQPTRAVFSGRGLGHGVGMSQWGAQGMAQQGHTYREILLHYYPGIELRQLP